MARCSAKFNSLKLPLDIAERNNKDEIRKYYLENPSSLKCFVMSSRHHTVLFVPPLYANGWVRLEEESTLFSLSNLEFADAKHNDIRIDPYIIGKEKWEVIGR